MSCTVPVSGGVIWTAKFTKSTITTPLQMLMLGLGFHVRTGWMHERNCPFQHGIICTSSNQLKTLLGYDFVLDLQISVLPCKDVLFSITQADSIRGSAGIFATASRRGRIFHSFNAKSCRREATTRLQQSHFPSCAVEEEEKGADLILPPSDLQQSCLH